MSNKKEEKKSINDMIIEEAVKQFKEGKIQNSLDVESYLDGLLTGFEEKCIVLYAKGVSLRDIEQTLKEIYGVKINKEEISRLISTVSEEVETWKKPMQNWETIRKQLISLLGNRYLNYVNL